MIGYIISLFIPLSQKKNNKNQIFYFHLGNDLHLAQCFE